MGPLETVTDWFMKPAGQLFLSRAEHDHAVALLADRKALVNKITSAKENRDSALPGLIKAEQKLEQDREELLKRQREELLQLDKRLDTARQKRHQADWEYDGIVGPAERQLRITASHKIRDFSRALEHRRQGLGSGDHEFGTSHDGRQIIVASSYPSLQKAALRILEIQREVLPKLELEALSDEELDARLTEIEATIPAVKMEKVG